MKKFILCLVVGAALLFGLFVGVNAWSIYKFSKVDETRKADAAIILGAALTMDGVSPVFRERINHGIWLYENEYVDKVIITGGYGEGSMASDAYVGKKYAISKGVPEIDILIEEDSKETKENLENAKRVLDLNDLETALVVSDPLHMKRAMFLAEQAGIKAYSSPTQTTAYRGRNVKAGFLLREVFVYTSYRMQSWI